MTKLFSKPVALSIGPQACGAEILRSYFKTRSDVILPRAQEIFYFDRHVQRGPDFYKSHFVDHPEAALFMELTTTAFDYPQAPERVKELLGEDVKLFCPLRDPVSRSYDVYRHYLHYGIVKGSIQQACEQAPQILFASRYADHVENWLAHFNDIHFLRAEALESEKDVTIQNICTVLGLPYALPLKHMKFPNIFMKLKTKKYREKPQDPLAIEWLRAELKGEAQRLNALIDCHLFDE